MIGHRIRTRRLQIGITQPELATELRQATGRNVVKQQISEWETCRTNPNIEYLLPLATVLRTSTRYLLGSVDDPSEPEHGQSMELTQSEKEIITALRNFSIQERDLLHKLIVR